MDKGINLILGGFLAILIGVVTLGVLADETETVKEATKRITNEAVAESTSTTLANDELVAILGCANASGIPHTANVNCNISDANAGIVSLELNNSAGNVFLNYTYTPDTYVRSAAARTLLSTNIIFYAIAVMLTGVGMVVFGFKDLA